MTFLGVLKRALPFFATFAAGIFIASFFVSVASPSFNFPRKNNRCREVRQLRVENDRLQRENTDLRQQLEEAGRYTVPAFNEINEAPVPPPPPPPAKKQYRVDR